MEAETILVVDDNKEIVYSISELLKYEGYQVIKAYDGMEALEALEKEKIDLILLDVMMPRLNGLSALMKLRQKSRIPVIILSAKTEESDKVSGLILGAEIPVLILTANDMETDEVRGLTLGADDYVEKPYNPAELTARIKAHLRRYHLWGEEKARTDEDRIVNGGLELDKKQKLVIVEGEEVRLTATEYKIFELLMEHPGQIFPALLPLPIKRKNFPKDKPPLSPLPASLRTFLSLLSQIHLLCSGWLPFYSAVQSFSLSGSSYS